MTRAENLVKRIITEFESRGYEVKCNSNGDYRVKNENNKKIIEIRETYHHNGSNENVTAKLEVLNLAAMFNTNLELSLYKTKIPYEATNKAINKRIDKALEYYQ